VLERLQLEGAQVIDIGCGEGWLTQLVAPETRMVIGIDPSVTALERANAAKNTSNELFLLASADHLPLDSGWADIAIYYNSLHHVPAALQHKALEETVRVLADGGLLCIVEPVASGSAYELFKPIDDETAVYAATYQLILEAVSSNLFQQELEELFIDDYTYRDFEQFTDNLKVVDERRAVELPGLEDMLRERFNRLGEAVEGGRRYDQIHRLSLLQKL
jgi:hypothetical protein